MRPRYLVTILVLLALAGPASLAHAGGIVGVCDEAHLLAALAGGGTVVRPVGLGRSSERLEEHARVIDHARQPRLIAQPGEILLERLPVQRVSPLGFLVVTQSAQRRRLKCTACTQR